MARNIFEQINQNVVDLNDNIMTMYAELKEEIEAIHCALYPEEEEEEKKDDKPKEVVKPNLPGIPMGPNMH